MKLHHLVVDCSMHFFALTFDFVYVYVCIYIAYLLNKIVAVVVLFVPQLQTYFKHVLGHYGEGWSKKSNK